MDALTNIPQAALSAVEDQARDSLAGTVYPQLVDALTPLVYEALRTPDCTGVDVREAERLLALQLLTGRRGGA